MTITRRDFLNGAALAIAAGVAPLRLARAAAASGASGASGYPPSLTGLRGNHPGTFTLAHSLAREGTRYPTVLAREAYDLVVVGGGISGLAAAWFYRQRFGNGKRILILDNHDDFGGHAKRNEFTVRGKRLVSYGGSAGMPPSAAANAAMAELLRGLRAAPDVLARAARLPDAAASTLGRAVFFNREHFGRDRLASGDPFGEAMAASMLGRPAPAGAAFDAFLRNAPLPERDRDALTRLAAGATDYLEGMPAAERTGYARRTSYAAFLRDKAGVGLPGVRFLRSRTCDAYGLDIDGVPVDAACALGLPGGRDMPRGDTARLGQSPVAPLWFADGNAGLARLLVRELIPAAAPAGPAQQIGAARFDYGRLDEEGAPVRLRLSSTAIAVEPEGRLVRVTYGWQGNLHRVEAAHVVLAGYNMMIPFLLPTLPEPRRRTLRDAVKAPVIYTKVALDHWQAFAALKAGRIHAPTMPYSDCWLELSPDADPSQPVVLHMVQVPTVPDSGMPARDRFRAGRALLLGTPFDVLERDIRQQLDRMLSPAGFASDAVVRGITVNRWAHGYSYMPNSLYDADGSMLAPAKAVATPYPHVTIANSDSAGSPSVTAAVEQGRQAVARLPG